MSSIIEPPDDLSDPRKARKVSTKIVATIGPACQDVDTLHNMLLAGMSVARVDLTWGPLEYHQTSLRNLQEAMRRARRLCAVMVDTLGREVMVRRPFVPDESGWPNFEESIHVKEGQRVTLTTRGDVKASAEVLPVTLKNFTGIAWGSQGTEPTAAPSNSNTHPAIEQLMHCQMPVHT